MNIFSSASARFYPSALLLTSALAMSCAVNDLPSPSYEPITQDMCTDLYLDFLGQLPWANEYSELHYIEDDAAIPELTGTVIFLPFLGSGGFEGRYGAGLQCLVTIDEQYLSACQRTYISQLPRIHNGAQYAELNREYGQCRQAEACQTQEEEDLAGYLEAGIEIEEAAEMARNNRAVCLCNVYGPDSASCPQND